jgi:hypothetical protein
MVIPGELRAHSENELEVALEEVMPLLDGQAAEVVSLRFR